MTQPSELCEAMQIGADRWGCRRCDMSWNTNENPPCPKLEARPNMRQVGGEHYQIKPIQPWDYIVANDIGFLAGNVVKYVTRYKDKGGVADLEKAKHYLEKLIEVEQQAGVRR